MSHEPFANVDVSTLVVKKPRANETAGKSAWIDRTREDMPSLFTSDKNARLLWPIRPGATDGMIKEHERLNLEISCSPDEEQKARECDEMFLDSLFAMKIDFFGSSKAKNITSKEVIKPMYKNLLREGATAKDGSSYANSFRMKVDGWAAYVNKVNIIEKVKENGEKMKLVKDCSWKDRIVEENDRNAPSDRDTHFFLFLGMNPNTNKPRYTDRVVCLDQAGKPIVKGEKDGKPVYQMRYVGPQDAMPGSNLTVVWSLSKLYLTETTGPTSTAKDIYIKPQVKKTKAVRGLDDVEVDECADANESIAILSSMRADDEEDNIDIPTKETTKEAHIPDAFVTSADESRKRKTVAASEGTPSGSSKKKKSVIIEEDF
jgi:hypothetical protein